MPKILLKIIAILSGIGILFYLLGSRASIWEIDAVQKLKEKSGSGPAKTVLEKSSSAAAKDKDDLKRIKGIGAVIEEKLNNIGYHRLEQIAKLTEEEKDQIEEQLSFPGRINRDQWVEQARALLSPSA